MLEELNRTVAGDYTDSIQLAFPVMYDPDEQNFIQFRGFRSKEIYPDLDIDNYISSLQKRGKTSVVRKELNTHIVQVVDDQKQVSGEHWQIYKCLVFETMHDERRLYSVMVYGIVIDRDLALEVESFFNSVRKVEMPKALSNEDEKSYNERITGESDEMICLDRRLVRPADASSPIEFCDLMRRDHEIIHVKNRTSSSRLSHLFSQGTVSAQAFATDATVREFVRDELRSAHNAVKSMDGRISFLPQMRTFNGMTLRSCTA